MVVVMTVTNGFALGLRRSDASDHASCANKVRLQLVETTLQLRWGPEAADAHDFKVVGGGPTTQKTERHARQGLR